MATTINNGDVYYFGSGLTFICILQYGYTPDNMETLWQLGGSHNAISIWRSFSSRHPPTDGLTTEQVIEIIKVYNLTYAGQIKIEIPDPPK